MKEFQLEMLADLEKGHDIIGIHATGSGKSLIFQILAVGYPHWSNIVIMPTRALIQDQIAKLEGYGLTAKHLKSNEEVYVMNPGRIADAQRVH
mgnify:CR=1 FL=1